MGPVSVSIRRFWAAREARSALRAATNASFRSLASPARALRRPALLLAAFATAAKHVGNRKSQTISPPRAAVIATGLSTSIPELPIQGFADVSCDLEELHGSHSAVTR